MRISDGLRLLAIGSGLGRGIECSAEKRVQLTLNVLQHEDARVTTYADHAHTVSPSRSAMQIDLPAVGVNGNHETQRSNVRFKFGHHSQAFVLTQLKSKAPFSLKFSPQSTLDKQAK
jgi:hypothetical protein